LVDDIAFGRVDSAIFGPRATELDQERKRLESQLAAADAPKVITLHPGVLADYERKLERLQQAIELDIQEGDPAHAQAIRDLVERVTVRHKAECPENIEIEITGRLNSLLGDKAFPNRVGRLGGSGGGLPPFPTSAGYTIWPSLLRLRRKARITSFARIKLTPHRLKSLRLFCSLASS